MNCDGHVARRESCAREFAVRVRGRPRAPTAGMQLDAPAFSPIYLCKRVALLGRRVTFPR